MKKVFYLLYKMLHGCEGLSILKIHSEQLFKGKDIFVLNNERNFSISVPESLMNKSYAKINQLD